MWYKIREGKHRASPLSLGIHTGKTSESYEVIFDDSCRYLLDEENQQDWNKGGGWSYGLHHTNSVRWVWRFNPELDKIEVCLYIYDSGIRKVIDEYCIPINFNERTIIKLTVDSHVRLEVGDNPSTSSVIMYNNLLIPKWGYSLGCYFGGNLPSPVNLEVWIKKLKKH